MSTEIDQRVVEMRFDNKNFEKNVSTSMKTLEKFKQSLKFSGAIKGMDELERKTSEFNMNKMESAVESVEMKFSALSIVAISAINRIVSQATDAGIKLVKSLSVDNIAAGWQKFADKTTSVGTLVAQGYDITEVEKELRRLNWFTDETSYNFTDMVSNIAKFTATGKKLKESVTALEGIANWAAMSGQNAQVASRAMYQLSQAMGAGVMRKEDWKSIQNVSMDTDEFRQKALDAAVALGTLKQNTDGTYQSLMATTDAFQKSQFAEHLTQDAWFTSDVMMKVYTDYSKAVDQIYAYAERKGITASQAIEELGDSVDEFSRKAFLSAQEARTWADVIGSVQDAVSTGWMNTFEILFGNYEEAKGLFTDLANELYDVFAEGGNRRNLLLTQGLGSGWSNLLKEGVNDGGKFKQDLLDIMREAGELDDELDSLARSDFYGFLKSGAVSAETLMKTLMRTTSVLHQYANDSEMLNAGYSQSEIDQLKALYDAMYSGELSIDKYLELLSRDSGRENLVQSFWNIWNALNAIDEESEKAVGIISIFKEAVGEIFPALTPERIYDITVKIRQFTEGLILTGEQADGLKNILKALLTPFKWLADIAGWGFKKIGTLAKYVGNLAGSFLELFKDAKPAEVILTKLFGKEKSNAIILAYGKAIERIRTEFGKLKENAKSAWNTLKADPKVAVVLETIQNALAGIASWVGDKILAGLEALKRLDLSNALVFIANGFIALKDAGVNAYNTIKSFITDLDWSSAKNWFGNIATIFGRIKAVFTTKIDPESGLGKIISFVRNITKDLPGLLSTISNALLDFAQNLTPSKILIFAFGITLVSMLANLNKLAQNAANLVGSVSSIVTTFQKKLIKTGPILQFATAITVLTAALVVLAFLPAEDLKRAAIVLGTLVVAIGAVGAVLLAAGKKLTNPAVAIGLDLFAKAVMKLSASVLLLTVALRVLAGVDTKHIGVQLFALSGLLVEFIGAGILLSRFAPNLASIGLSLIGLSVAVLILANALKKFNKIDPSSTIKAVVGMIPLLIAFSSLGRAAGRGTFSGAIGLTVMAANILIMVKVLKKLETVDPASLIAVIPQYLILVGALAALGLALRAAGKGGARSGVGMLAMIGSIYILVGAIEQLGSMDSGALGRGLTAVIALLGVFTLITGLSGLVSKDAKKLTAPFIAMSAAILMLTLPIKILGKELTPEQAQQGTKIVLALLGTFAAILAISKLSAKSGAAIIGIAMVIGTLTAALVLLTIPDYSELMGAAKALGLVIGALGVALLGMNVLVNGNVTNSLPSLIARIGSIILSVVEVAALLGVVMVAMNHMPKDISGDTMRGFGIGVAGLLTGMAILVAAVNKFPPTDITQVLNIAAEIGLLTTALGLIGAGLMYLYSRPEFKSILSDNTAVMNIVKAFGLMAVLGVAITPAALAMTLMYKLCPTIDIPALTAAAVGMLEAAGVMLVVLTAIGALYAAFTANDVDGKKAARISEILDGVVEVALKMGEAIGAFVGGLAGGLVGGAIGGSILVLCTTLGQAIAGLFGPIQDLKASAASNLKTMAEALLVFSEAGFLQFLGGTSAKKLSEELGYFADALIVFADKTRGIDFSGTEEAAKAGKALAELEKALPREWGALQFLIGNHQSMEDFGIGIQEFGNAITKFINTIPAEGINETAVRSAVNAGKLLAGLEKALPNEGGALQWLIGENQNMVQFAKNMETFAYAITGYVKIINDETGGKGIDESVVRSSVNAGKLIAGLENSLPREGGILQDFIGHQSMTKFAIDMANFGRAIVGYSALVAGNVDPVAVGASAAAGMMLSKLENSLPETGGVLQTFLGEQNLGTFSTGIMTLGWALATYSERVASINLEGASNATKVAKEISDLANSLGDSKVAQFLKGDETLTQFGRQMSAFGQKIKEYGNNISGTNWDDVERSASVVTKLADMSRILEGLTSDGAIQLRAALTALGNMSLTEFTDVFKNANVQTTISETGLSLVTSFAASINEAINAGSIEIEARRMVGVFCVYFTDAAKNRATTVGAGLVTIIADSIKSQTSSKEFNTVGFYIIEGIKKGIEDNWGSFQYYMIQKAIAIKRTFQEALEIESPSKVMRDEVGRYIIMGIAEGITSNMSAEEAAAKKAQNITEAFKDAFSKHDAELKRMQLSYETRYLESPFMSEKDVKALELEKLGKEVEFASERLKTSFAKYKTAMEQFEEGTQEWLDASNEYTQAYNEWLKVQASYTSAKNSQNDIKLTFDDTGKAMINGFLSGITSDMTMEEAVKKKAENILTAFQDYFDTNTAKSTIVDLQRNMWSIFNPEYDEHVVGFNETEQENSTKQMVSKILKNQQDISEQAKKVQMARAQYNAIVKAVGADSDKAKEAYASMVQEETALAQLAADQQDLKKYKPSYSRAMELIEGMTETERANWFTVIAENNPIKQIFDAALDAAGDVPEIVLENFEEAFAPLTDASRLSELTDGVEVVFKQDIPQAITGSIGAVTDAAGEVADAVGSTLKEQLFGQLDSILVSFTSGSLTDVSGAIGKIPGIIAQAIGTDFYGELQDKASTLLSKLRDFGSAVPDGYAEGVQNGASKAVDSVASMINGALNQIPKIQKSNSPSKVTEQFGEYFTEGFGLGIINLIPFVVACVKHMTETAITETENSMKGIVAKIDQVLQGDLDFTPSISPVLDLSDVYATASRLGGLLDTSGTYTMANNAYSDAEEARMAHEDYMTQVLIDSIGRKLDSLGYSLDDLREVVEQRGGDIDIDVNVDGASLARATVNDYISASRANGTPFYTEIDV